MVAKTQPLRLALVEGQSAQAEQTRARLTHRAQAGDRPAFEQLLERHERQVANTAWRLLGHREDTQDAAQEVFLRLFRHLDTIDPNRDLAPWLYRVTVNVCRDVARRRRRQPTDSLPAPGAPEPRQMADPAADPARRTAASEELRIVEQGLATLSHKERSALVLRDLEGLSTRQVANILSSSETTVRSQICRARLNLKQFRDRRLKRRFR